MKLKLKEAIRYLKEKHGVTFGRRWMLELIRRGEISYFRVSPKGRIWIEKRALDDFMERGITEEKSS